MSETERWKCPECGHTKPKRTNESRPICPKCDWRDAVHIEMEADS